MPQETGAIFVWRMLTHRVLRGLVLYKKTRTFASIAMFGLRMMVVYSKKPQFTSHTPRMSMTYNLLHIESPFTPGTFRTYCRELEN